MFGKKIEERLTENTKNRNKTKTKKPKNQKPKTTAQKRQKEIVYAYQVLKIDAAIRMRWKEKNLQIINQKCRLFAIWRGRSCSINNMWLFLSWENCACQVIVKAFSVIILRNS